MNKNSEKELEEQRVFKCFLNAIGDRSSTFLSRHPPYPDILLKKDDGTKLAFELMEICSPTIAKAMSAVEKNPSEARYINPFENYEEKFKKKLKNAYVSDCPINLLCYAADRVVTTDDIIIEDLKNFTNGQIIKFHEIWFMGAEVTLIYPQFDSKTPATSE